ncbi:glycosyltransferase family 4 protein [Candidatus Woesearchaeota archaeon]|nr:glycosyltransferase family 4 protein [Candidatus Woesearchaeota archaeon]
MAQRHRRAQVRLPIRGGVLQIPLASKDWKKKPRLVIASDSFLPRWDGISRFLAEVIPRLAEKYDITAIAPDYGHVDLEGCRVIKVTARKRRFGDYQPARLRYWLVSREAKRADVVFAQSIGPIGASAIIAAKRHRRPVVCYIHNLESQLVPLAIGPNPLRKLLYPLMRWYSRLMYNKADLLITPSEWVSDELFWNRITRAKRVVRLGVDTDRFRPGDAEELRRKLGIGEEDVVIGQHGRLAREKDLKTLLRSFIRLRAKDKHVKLLIIGEGVPSIKRLLERQEGVILPGKQDDVTPYLQALDVFVLTSLTETTCLAALEAMSCGKPVVSTPVGFVKDYVKDGENGFLIDTGDAYALKQKLAWLIEHPTLRGRMGTEARKTVLDGFGWEQTITGIEAALQEAMER